MLFDSAKRSVTLCLFIFIPDQLYPATRCCGSVWVNGKKKAHVSNMLDLIMLVGRVVFNIYAALGH